MPSWSEVRTAIMRGLGFWPTSFLLRWSPTLMKPFRFDLLEVMRCETDGGVVTMRSAQHPRTAPLHAGHYIKNPRVYSLWEWLKVQLRIIR
jgi:hypothetical protein